MQSSLPDCFASLPGLDFDLSYEDCQSLLDGHAEAQAGEAGDSPKPQSAGAQKQERHDSMDSCLLHEPSITKTRSRKPRSQEQAREAQKRFRMRQKARSENLHSQLKDTQSELQKLKLREQQLVTRNCLLEKVAQINEVQKSVECLMWEGKKAILDFPCAHTEQTDQGFALKLTIFGEAESKTAIGVSDMPIEQMASLWKEYISKLSSCLLSLQHDQHGAARQKLNRWTAEARALLCCVRAYNPQALKALETSSLNESDFRPAPSKQFYYQQLEILLLSAEQVSDLLCIYQLHCLKLAEIGRQRQEILSHYAPIMTGGRGQRPHPSDGLALADKLQAIGLEEYKFHGQVYDAVFYGVLSSVQSALELVHAYPYLVEPTPLLEALAEQCGQVQTPLQSPLAQEEAAALDAQYDVFRQYVNSVTARDYFEHASMTAVQKLNPVRVLKERQQALLASQMAQHDANQPSGSPFSMVGSHSLQHTRITVPTLDELLLDDSTEGVAGPGSRRGFDHVYNMPQDHKFVRLLGELAGPPKFPSPPDSIAAGVAPAPLTDHAADPLVALGLEMHGRS